MNGRIDQSVSGPCNLVIASIMDLPKDQDDKDGSKGDLNNEGLGEPLKNDVKSADTGNLGRLTSSSISGSAESGFNGVENEISWFAKDPSKAYYEKISLVWAPLSMFLLLVVLLGTPLHRLCGRNSYLAISLFGCVPGFAIPLLRPCKADLDRPILERFWVKGTIWISIFGFYGNYFWTHYFYTLLGAEYKFDSYRFNDVPVVTYICTFFYFTFYFSFVNVVLRRIAYMTSDFPPFGRSALWIFSIAALSYGTAIFEAISIQHFPLYTYKQRDLFLFIGSVVYGLYFIVGFPMFFSLDEEYDDTKDNIEHVPGEKNKTSRVSLAQVTLNVFAACAIVTLLLDLWRLFLGSIYDLGSSSSVQLPFIYQGSYASTPAHCSLSQSPTASASIPPVPTIETIYVEQPVTIDACVKVAKGWAQSKVLEVQKTLQQVKTEFMHKHQHGSVTVQFSFPPSQQTQTTSHSLHHHQPTPARKCLISHARTLPKQTIVWIQGTIVAMTDNQIAIDDGSGIARVQVNPKRDVAHPAASLRVGSYIMAAGQMVAKLKGFKMGMRALSVRDLTENVPFLQTLWNLEVVDAYLYHQKNQGSVATRT